MIPSLRSPFESRSLAELLWSRAELYPERTAFRFIGPAAAGRRSVTYAELLEMARAAAAALVRCGPPDQRVMLMLPPSLELVAAFFGCMLAQKTVALSPPPRKPRDERVALDRLARLRPVVLVVSDPVSEALRDPLREGATPVLSLPELFTGRPLIARNDDESDRVVLIQYTSGSTSAPAGCRITNANLLHNSKQIYHCFGHTGKSVGLVWTPPYHDMGLVGGIVQPVYGGFETSLMSPQDFVRDPLSWLRAISDLHVTTSGGPDFAYELCVRAAARKDPGELDLSRWTVAYSGAEPVRAATLKRFTQRFSRYGFREETFLPCYGLAEATLMVTAAPLFRSPTQVSAEAVFHGVEAARAQAKIGHRSLVGCGFPDAETTIRIVDPEKHIPCAPRQVGEIWVQGPSVAAGYHDDPGRTSHVFEARLTRVDAGAFLRTGDLGLFYKRELFVVGRRKDLLILNGVNYHPEDLEEVAQRVSLRLRAGCVAAFSVETTRGEELVVMAEVDDVLPPEELDAIIQSVAMKLRADFERAPDIVVLFRPGQVPRTYSGKVQRALCRDLYLANDPAPLRRWRSPRAAATENAGSSFAGALPDAPPPDLSGLSREERREQIALQIEAWLRHDLDLSHSILRDANLGIYGIDSLAATQLAARLEQWLGRPLTAMLAWDYPNIDSLSEYLSNPPPPEDTPSAASALSDQPIPEPAGPPDDLESDDLQAPPGLPRALQHLANEPPARAERPDAGRKRLRAWRMLRRILRMKQSGEVLSSLPPIGRVIARDWSVEMISMFVQSFGRRSYIDQPTRLPTPAPAKPLVEVRRFNLTDADIERFYRQSYLGPYRLMSAKEAARMGAEILAHAATPSAIYGFPSVRDRHLDMPELQELFRRPEITERVAQLLGPDLICWRSQLFHKEPGDPAIEWHQASTYLLEDRVSPILRPKDPDRLFQLTIWIAFNDANEENGCLEIFPGSHGRIRTVRRSDTSGFYNAKYILELEKDIGAPVKLPVQAGEFLIFTERAVHGSGPNRAARSRCGLNFRVIAPDVSMYRWKTSQRTIHEPDGRAAVYHLAKWRPVMLRSS